MKYNVILITIDCFRSDHLGALGYHKDITPNLNRLANEGVLFSNAFSTGSATYSVMSIFTSMWPLMAGFRYIDDKIKDRLEELGYL